MAISYAANPTFSPEYRRNVEVLFATIRYPHMDLNMTQDTRLVTKVDERMRSKPLPQGTGFSTLASLINTINKAYERTPDMSPETIMQLAAKIDHMDKVNKDIIYDNIKMVLSLMYYTSKNGRSDIKYMDHILKQLFVSQVYLRYCGIEGARIQLQGKRNIKLFDALHLMFKTNDKYIGRAR